MVARIVAASPGPEVLDVGCGTGIAARQFQAAGCRVLGVDVDERMAGFARRGGLGVEVAAFEAWDRAGRTFDAVIAAQSWHWVNPVAGAARAAEALRPGGRLAVFWNAAEPPPELAEAFAAAVRHAIPEAPAASATSPSSPTDPYKVMRAAAADGIRAEAGFGEPEEWRFDWDQLYTRDQWLDQLPTQGGFTRLPAAALDEVLAGIGAAIDAAGGAFTMHYATVVVTATRTA
jgi:SAM-dependent methyltransferase